MEGREMRRTMSTASNHTTLPSNHRIRDRDEEAVPTRGFASRSTTIGASERREAFASRVGGGASSSRTLMDIIQEEHAMRRGEFPGATANGGINWRSFKERLCSRKEEGSESDAGGGHELDIGLPTSPVFGRSTTLRLNQLRSRSGRGEIVSEYNYPVAAAAAAAGEGVEQPPPPPATVSLMSLLADGDEDEEEEEEEEEGGDEEGEEEEEEMYYECCVCMVRHKGSAFVPCGHTFCRLCSRELWVSRGNCPLCNGYILEILNIF